MAHEPSEWSTHYDNCLCRITLPKSKAIRLATIQGIDALPNETVIRPEMSVAVRIQSASGEWRARSYPWATFNEIAEIFVPRSQFMNTSRTCGYYNHNVRRQYGKGVRASDAPAALAMTAEVLTPEEMWRHSVGEKAILPGWEEYYINYGLPYAGFWDAHTSVIDGRAFSRAFGRNLALFNIPTIKYPVLYVGLSPAGVVAKNALHLTECFAYLAPYLSKRAGIEIKTAKEIQP